MGIVVNGPGPAYIIQGENTMEAARQRTLSEAAADRSALWAEGTLPGGAGTKSAKEHATAAGVSETNAAASAAGAAASVATGVAGVPASIGATADAATTTLGYLTGSTATGSSIWIMGDVIPEQSLISAWKPDFTAAATVDVCLISAATKKILRVATGLTMASGANNMAVPFGAIITGEATYFAHRVTSGTGRCKYTTAGSGSMFHATDAAFVVGNALTFVADTATWTLNAQLVYSTVSDAHTSRIKALETADIVKQMPSLGEVQDTTTYSLGSFGLSRNGDVSATSVAFISIAGDCTVTSIDLNMNAAGSGMIEGWRLVAGALVMAYRRFVTLAAGDNLAVAIKDWNINAGGAVSYHAVTGTGPTYNSTGSMLRVDNPAAYDFGDTLTPATFSPIMPNFRVNVRLPKRRSYRATRATINGPVTQDYQTFPGTTAPTGWTVATPFSVNDGLAASGTGAADKVALWKGCSAVSKRKIMGRILLNDVTTTIHGICTKPTLTSGGSAALIDCVAGKLRLYSWNGSTTLALQVETAFTAALVAGRYYNLSVTRDLWTITAVLTDTVTGTTTTATTTTANSGTVGRLQGQAGAMHVAGDVKWDWLHPMHTQPRMARAVVMADSNGEGTVLTGGSSWIAQLDATYGGVVQAAFHGDTSAGAVTRISDITDFRPARVILALATNDASQAAYRLSTRTLIDTAVMIGAEPILCTPPPRASTQAMITAIANDVTSGFFGRYRYIDLLGALSNNNDRLTWNAAYVQADTVHMTAAGQTRAMQQALADVPDVFA